MNPLATMTNRGGLLEVQYVTPPEVKPCPWKHPETCRECPVKCHLTKDCHKCGAEILDGVCTNPDCGIQIIAGLRDSDHV